MDLYFVWRVKLNIELNFEIGSKLFNFNFYVQSNIYNYNYNFTNQFCRIVKQLS